MLKRSSAAELEIKLSPENSNGNLAKKQWSWYILETRGGIIRGTSYLTSNT